MEMEDKKHNEILRALQMEEINGFYKCDFFTTIIVCFLLNWSFTKENKKYLFQKACFPNNRFYFFILYSKKYISNISEIY